MRPSSPRRSEPRSPKRDTSTSPEPRTGRKTRRPSARMATATWRRSRPWKRLKARLRCTASRCVARPCGSGSLAGCLDCATMRTAPDRTAASRACSWSEAAPAEQPSSRRTNDADGCRARHPSARFSGGCRPVRRSGPGMIAVVHFRGPSAETGRVVAGGAGGDGSIFCSSFFSTFRSKLGSSFRSNDYQRQPAASVIAIDASSAMARVKRARFAFTFVSLSNGCVRLESGSRAVSSRWQEIPGFASPPHDGFALDGRVGERRVLSPCVKPYGRIAPRPIVPSY
jgi:hypothetical protein